MKILVGTLIDGELGGLDRFIMNFLKLAHEYRPDIQFDFLTNRIIPELKERLKAYESNLYEIATLKHPFKQQRQIEKLLKDNNYDAAYMNVSTSINLFGMRAAYKQKTKYRILHTHASGNDTKNPIKKIFMDLLNFICKPVISKYATDYWTNSQASTKWVFSRKTRNRVKVIPLAIDVDKFQFNPVVRDEYRASLGLSDKFVIGHVGSLTYVKNHKFLIDIFHTITKEVDNSALLLIGSGDLMDETMDYVKALNLDESVHFLGQRNDVDKLMQAMDIFALPSRFEGLGYVALEAQAASVKCFLSDTIPQEANITGECIFLPIQHKEDARIWAAEILKYHNGYTRQSYKNIFEQKDFLLGEHYLSLMFGDL